LRSAPEWKIPKTGNKKGVLEFPRLGNKESKDADYPEELFPELYKCSRHRKEMIAAL